MTDEGLIEYSTGQEFPGRIGRTPAESTPAWPRVARATPGAPNVVFVVLDDVGFGQLGPYGAPIRTPNFDRLAANGLTYTNMHTTALCSPTRSCVLTGRNHHSNAMSSITEVSLGYPGSNGNIPFENGFLSEILRKQGYATFGLGKWHLSPAEQTRAAGPFNRWPTGRGFDKFYGFLGGDSSQYYPELVRGTEQVEPPSTPEEGYHLTEDLVKTSIGYIADLKQLDPDKPFFLYLATGAAHTPHHVPKEWSDAYAGEFDDGWEAYRAKTFARQIELGIIPEGTLLSGHDPDVQRWADCSADEQRLYARFMEVFAGFITHTDHHIGLLLEFLERIGELDNTVVMLISDNGASAEGGPTGSTNENKFFNMVPDDLQENLAAIDELGGPTMFNHYPWGWAWAGDTPLRRWKRETYQGGTTDPFIVQWPAGISARGQVRRQYAHAIDMVPTILEALNVIPPESINGYAQADIEGTSFAYSFDDADAASRHTTQYFEMFGHRAIFHEGWRAVCPVPGPSFAEAGMPFGAMELTQEKLDLLDSTAWELYRIDSDFSETDNVAAQNPEKLKEMIALWYSEAERYQVFPIDASAQQRLLVNRPQLAAPRTKFVYWPHTSAVPENAAVRVLNRAHSITAQVVIPESGAEGVLLAHGGNAGGYSLWVQDGKLHYVHNYVGIEEFHVESDQPVPTGNVRLRFEFEPTGAPDIANGKGAPGRAQLYIDDQLVGQSDMPHTVPLLVSLAEGLTCGRNGGSSVSARYAPPYEFTGTLLDVTVDVSGEDLIEDDQARIAYLLSRQ